jgi:dTDP-glucose pyrophosphorylase
VNKSWKKVAISSETSIRDALQVIDENAIRIALVINDSFELLGVVSDGDIRRGILKSISLESPVCDIMNRNPFVCESGTDKTTLIEEMNKRDILSVPLIKKGKLVGLSLLHDELIDTPRYENPVFIMAGGFGTRLRPLTDNCPKPMLHIGDKPILETVILSFINSGFVNFYISTHFMPEIIHDYFGDGSKWGVNILYVHEEAPLGTGGALGLLPRDMPDLPIIMMNGDVLTKVNFERLLSFHNENSSHATMCVREYDSQIPYGVIKGEGNKIISMIEKPIQRFFVNAGIYVVSQELARSVPLNHEVDMPTLLEQCIEQRYDVLMFPIHEYWLDIGRMDDFNRAQADIYSLGMDT